MKPKDAVKVINKAVKERKLKLVDVDESIAHPGQALWEQLSDRIKKRESSEGAMVWPEGFFSLANMLMAEKDPIDALTWYGELSGWLDEAVSRDKHKARESLRWFLESRQ